MTRSKGVALVTGSAQGVGRAIAIRLARDVFDVALNDLPVKNAVLEDLAAEIRFDELGSLDVMVANAGIAAKADILNGAVDILTAHVHLETVENWERMMTVNVTSTFLCYKYSAMQMVKQGRGGRIIGASSAVGKQAMASLMSYSATLQLGRNGITVNSYAPGPIETPMLTSLRPQDAKQDVRAQKLIDATAVGYIGQPENIASAVSYIASKEAHFITGQCISVDGGLILSGSE
ncbi:NAD(P)-binding protein, partial [Rhizopogon vinicolor AM-OR11-026]